MEYDVLYSLTAQGQTNLAPGESYTDTIDWGKYINYDLVRGETYQVWLEHDAWGLDLDLSDTSTVAPVWPQTIVSDTLEFTF